MRSHCDVLGSSFSFWPLLARQLSRGATPGGGVTKLINMAINNDRYFIYCATVLMYVESRENIP